MATEDLTPNPETGTTGQEEPELSLRDELEAAFEAEPSDELRQRDQGDDRPRDELGRFAPKEGETEPHAKGPQTAQEPPVGTTQGVAPGQAAGVPPAPQPAELKAPQSWRPEVREKWAGVDPEVRGEIHRREREHQHFMEQAAGARQFIDAFERTVRPYEMFIRAENSNPLAAVESLMQSAAALRVGTPEQKVGLVAGIIKNFSIDLPMLDAVLANNPLPPATMPMQQQAFRDPRLDQLLAQQQQFQQMQDQRETQELHGMLSQFENTHEFYSDVRMTMADLIEMAGRRGEVLTAEEAYKRACQLDPGVTKILAQRQTSQKTQGLTQAALRAKRAAASIKGDSTLHDGATVPRDDSVRAALEAAFEANTNM